MDIFIIVLIKIMVMFLLYAIARHHLINISSFDVLTSIIINYNMSIIIIILMTIYY